MIPTILLYISGILAVLGGIGMLRFPDFYTRTHAATMITVGGVCLALFALVISSFATDYLFSIKIFLIILFIALTSPTSTHVIAKKAYEMGIKPEKLVKNEFVLKKKSEGGRGKGTRRRK